MILPLTSKTNHPVRLGVMFFSQSCPLLSYPVGYGSKVRGMSALFASGPRWTLAKAFVLV